MVSISLASCALHGVLPGAWIDIDIYKVKRGGGGRQTHVRGPTLCRAPFRRFGVRCLVPDPLTPILTSVSFSTLRMQTLSRRCSCGDGFGGPRFPRQPEDRCSVACSGDRTQRCGSFNTNSIYRWDVRWEETRRGGSKPSEQLESAVFRPRSRSGFVPAPTMDQKRRACAASR